jgi:SAM-dependent methyltransferase
MPGPGDSVRRFGSRFALRVATRLSRRHYIGLDYPPSSDARPRWGYGRPSHPALAEIIGRHRDTYRASLERIARYRSELLAIPGDRSAGPEPHWRNPYLLGLDLAALYAFIRERAPRRYVEIGSGISTRVVAKARADAGLATEITSIDPHPRAEIDDLCDRPIRLPLEDVDPDELAAIGADSVVFVDDSHRVFMNSDATTFFLDVLPSLPAGTLVGVHDVLLPDDYLPEWRDWHYSEQYLLAAYLLGGGSLIDPVLACSYVSGDPELAGILAPLWEDPRLSGTDSRGFTFWFEVGTGGRSRTT